MSKDLPPAKLANLAESLSGKECALLAIEFNNKEDKEGKSYKEERETISAAISPYSSDNKRKEFYFYYKLWMNLSFFDLDVQTCLLQLRVLNNKLRIVSNALINSCLVDNALWCFRSIPKILTEEEFVELYKKVRAERLAEIMPVSQLAKHEAFLRLQEEGFLDEDDEHEAIFEYFEESGKKTKEEQEKIRAKEIKDYLDDQAARKARGTMTLDDGPYKEYEGLILEEIENKVATEEDFSQPDPKDIERWKRTVEEELAKLLKAIDKGILKTSRVVENGGWYHSGKEFIGQEGIIGESWYSYSEKRDKDFNKFIDNKEDLVEFYEGEVVVAKGRGASYKGKDDEVCSAEKSRQNAEERLKNMLYIQKKDSILDIIPGIKPHYLERIKETQETIQRLVNHVEVIKRADKQLFDNVIHIAEDLIKQAEVEIPEVVKAQDKTLKTVLSNFNILAFEKEVVLRDDAKYRLTTDVQPDEAWVKESIDHLIEIAERESGYTYRIEN